MKQLTLENIAWYLPYGLKGNYLLSDVVPTHKDELREKLLTAENVVFFVKYATPILLPMSDLTKPFIKDGEETTHLKMLYKICFPNGVNGIKDPINNKGFLHKNKYHFHYTKKGFAMRIGANETKFIAPNQFECMQYLAKEKFDFQNLIADGLAIDANTLETNPYL